MFLCLFYSHIDVFTTMITATACPGGAIGSVTVRAAWLW